jgi:hypothetical protein
MPELDALAVLEASPASSAAGSTDTEHPGFSVRVMNFGFVAGVVLAALCLVLSAYYLQQFLTATNEGVGDLLKQRPASADERSLITMGISARLVMARLALRSCGVFVGLSFGFLGFSLFLIGVRGVMSARGEYGDAKLTLARLSPGVFVIFCATVLIGLCVTMATPFEYTQTTNPQPVTVTTALPGPASSKPADSQLLMKDSQH